MIGIIGSAQPSKSSFRLAEEIGRLLVDEGFRIATGGLSGIMEAALKGASASASYREGDTVAIIPQSEAKAANREADIVIATGMGKARNLVLVQSCSALVTIEGCWGTLSEICFCQQAGKPVILLENSGGWSSRLAKMKADLAGEFHIARSANDLKTILDRLFLNII
jgi:uncharacterized protein (TIGR00725 family)